MSVTEPQREEPEHDEGRAPEHEHPDHHWLQVIVNAKEKEVDDRYLTYDDVLVLEYNGDPPSGPSWSFTVTYSRGPVENPHGPLTPGHSVKITQGMVFRVRATDRS